MLLSTRRESLSKRFGGSGGRFRCGDSVDWPCRKDERKSLISLWRHWPPWPNDRRAERIFEFRVDAAGDLVLLARLGFEPLHQRAALQVGQHGVELVGHFFELGQQIALLGDGLVDVLLGRLLGGLLAGLGLADDGGDGKPQRRGGGLALLRRSGCELAWRLLRGFHVDDARHGGVAGLLRLAAFLAATAGRRADLTDRRGIVGPLGRRGDTLGLRGLFQQIGHRRHPVGRDVAQDLEHLGPLVEMADADLRIASGLAEQAFAGLGQIGQPPAVDALGVGLALRSAGAFPACRARRATVARSRLLVSYSRQLAVADLQRLAMPAGELLGDPDRVLIGVEDEQRVRRGVDRAGDPDNSRWRTGGARSAAARCRANGP